MLRLALPLVIFLVLGGFLWNGIGKDTRLIPSPLIDKPAPEFNLPALKDENRQISKQSLLGQPYLLNVWGSWCPACRVEHPYITEIARSGLIQVYGLNWKDTRSEALRWLDAFGDPYAGNAFDESGRTGIDFGVYGAPETFLIDARGQILEKHVGPLDPYVFEAKFRAKIKALESS
jgi:cytochrome c biogenesis protein CcmG/thiol:disulfide interchange protein DsbE